MSRTQTETPSHTSWTKPPGTEIETSYWLFASCWDGTADRVGGELKGNLFNEMRTAEPTGMTRMVRLTSRGSFHLVVWGKCILICFFQLHVGWFYLKVHSLFFSGLLSIYINKRLISGTEIYFLKCQVFWPIIITIWAMTSLSRRNKLTCLRWVELSSCVQFRKVLLAFISFSQQRLEEAWERGVDLLDGLTRRFGSD